MKSNKELCMELSAEKKKVYEKPELKNHGVLYDLTHGKPIVSGR